MSDAVKICSILALSAMMSLLIKDKQKEIAYLIGVTGTVIAATFAVKGLTPILNYASSMAVYGTDAIQIVIRTLGIAYISEITALLCKDSGETGLASGVELVGKIEIIVISFPLIEQLLKLCTDLLK